MARIETCDVCGVRMWNTPNVVHELPAGDGWKISVGFIAMSVTGREPDLCFECGDKLLRQAAVEGFAGEWKRRGYNA